MIDLYPSDTVPLPPTVEPLKQQLLHFMPISHNSVRIVGYTVVVKMTSQFGFGYFPQFNGLQGPGFLQPFLECSQLCGKLLAGSNPLHPKPFAVSRSTAVVGQAKKIKRLSPSRLNKFVFKTRYLQGTLFGAAWLWNIFTPDRLRYTPFR